jgi:hypothetical protein
MFLIDYVNNIYQQTTHYIRTYKLKEYNCDIEWDFLEFFVESHSSEKFYKIETKNLWTAFEIFLENAGLRKKKNGGYYI